MPEYVHVAEVVAYDPGVPGTVTLRFSEGGGLVTTPTDTPASTWYDARLKNPGSVKRDLFDAGSTSGRSRVGYGDLVLDNADGGLDALLTYGISGRSVILRRGLRGAAYPAGFTTRFAGTAEQPETSGTAIVIKLRDLQADLLLPFQPTKYVGDNALPAGLEGVAEDLQGKPKPVTVGSVLNISPPCVNTDKLIYQVHDGALQSVDDVYDAGIALGQNLDSWQTTSLGFGTDPTRALAVGYFGTNLSAVVVGDNGKVANASDGSTWSVDSGAGFGSTHLYAVAFGLVPLATPGYIIAGASGALRTFDQPGSPTSRTSQFGASTIRALCYFPVGDLWVAVGDSGKISTSSDKGATWTAQTSGVATALYGVAAGPLSLVAVGAGGVLLTSTDGSTWASQTSGFGTSDIYGVVFGNAQWIAVGADDKIGRSLTTDATLWSVTTGSFGGTVVHRAVAVAGTSFITVGDTEAVATSSDGGIWVRRRITGGSPIDYLCTGRIPEGRWMAGDDGGGSNSTVNVTAGPGTYASLADLQDDTLAPAHGSYKIYLAGGYFRLGSPPFGQITADVTQGANAAARTAGQLFAVVLTRAGKSAGTAAGNWLAADVTALDSANSAVLGDWISEEDTFATVLDRIANSVGAWWGIDRTGVYRIQRFEAPSGSPVAVITENDIRKGSLARVTLSRDDSKGLPTWRTIVRYQRNYTVQTSGLAGSVEEPITMENTSQSPVLDGSVGAARRGFLAHEWREAVDEDTAVKTAHLLAVETTVETLLQSASAAATEADRHQTLRGVLRHAYDLTVPDGEEFVTIDLGQVVTLQHPRYGLSAGVLCRVLGVDPDGRGKDTTYRVWR